MVERALGEGLATGVGAEVGSEAERLHDGEVGEEGHLGGTRALLLSEDVPTAAGEDAIDVAHGILRHGDVAEVDRLEESRSSRHEGGEAHTAGGGHDLSHTTVNGISVEDDVHEVEPAAAHLLLADGTVLGSPGESTNDRLLNLEEVVDSLGGVDKEVGSSAVGAEGPDLTSLRDVPAELVGHLAALGLVLSSGVDVPVVNGIAELLGEGLGLDEETVVLVGGLGEAGVRLLGDSLTEGDDRVRDLDLGSHEVVLEILEADLEVELARGGNDVLTGFLGVAQNHWIGLSKALHALDKLGEIGRVLGLDSATDDRGDGELHGLDAVGIISGTDRTGLEEVLIDTDEGASVTGGDVSDLLGVAAHHDHGPLDILDPNLGLFARHVVGAHNANLLAGGDLAGEDTAESIETTLVRGGDHLGDVHAKRGVFAGVASADGSGSHVVKGSIVKGVDTVGLGLDRGGKVEHNHLKNGVPGGEPLLHDALEEGLADKLLLVGLELNADGVQHLLDLAVLLSHDGLEEGGHGGGDELAKRALEALAGVTGPLLAGGIVVPVTPKFVHHLVLGDVKLGTVGLGKLLEGEGPLVETGSEGDGSLTGVDLDIAERLVVVGGDDDVDGLDGPAEGLVELLSRELELEEGTIDLVDHEHGLDALGDGLAEDGLGLDADTINGVNNNEGSISDTEGSSDLRGEINVTGGVNEVDEVGVLGDLDVLVGLIGGGEIRGGLVLLSLGHISNISGLHVVLEKHGDASGLNGDTTLSLISTGVSVAGSSSSLGRNNSGLLDKGVSKSGLSVVHVSDNGHGADVVLEVHDGPHLVDSEVHLKVSNRVGEERDDFGSVYSVKIYNLAQSRGHVLLCAKGRGKVFT